MTVEISHNHVPRAEPGRGRGEFAFCLHCGHLVAQVPGHGWRHLVVKHAEATAARPSYPYVAFQADGTLCEPWRVAEQREERP